MKIKLEHKLEEALERTKVQQKDPSSKKSMPANTTSATTAVSAHDTSIDTITPATEDEIICTICAKPIRPVYIPRFFLGEEINPACDECKDSSVDDEDELENDDLGNRYRFSNETGYEYDY